MFVLNVAAITVRGYPTKRLLEPNAKVTPEHVSISYFAILARLVNPANNNRHSDTKIIPKLKMCYFPTSTYFCATENPDSCDNYGLYTVYLTQHAIEPCWQGATDLTRCASVTNKDMVRYHGLCQTCYVECYNQTYAQQPEQLGEWRLQFENHKMRDNTDFYVFTGENIFGFRDGCISRPDADMVAEEWLGEFVVLPFNRNQRVHRNEWPQLTAFYGLRERFVGVLSTQHPGYW